MKALEMRCHKIQRRRAESQLFHVPETKTKDMDNAVLATPPTDALWKDHHSTKKTEDNSPTNNAETLLKEKEDPILDHAIHYAINRQTFQGEEEGCLKKGCNLSH